MTQGSLEATDEYRRAKRAAALVVAEAKTQVCEEFGEAVQKDFRLASKVLANRQATQEGDAGLSTGCFQQVGRTADLGWGHRWVVVRRISK